MPSMGWGEGMGGWTRTEWDRQEAHVRGLLVARHLRCHNNTLYLRDLRQAASITRAHLPRAGWHTPRWHD
jgi:hypothetical protein